LNLSGEKIVLIGGAGLVGSYIVDQLTHEPVSEIVVYDNFIRGTRSNLADVMKSPKVRIVEASMTDRDSLASVSMTRAAHGM
jgi:UDP-glucose 4-epimerase